MKKHWPLFLVSFAVGFAFMHVWTFVTVNSSDSFKAQFASATLAGKLKTLIQYAPAAFGL